MNIVESLKDLENKLFEEKDEYHDLVGALLCKPTSKQMVWEMLQNNDVEGIIKCLEEGWEDDDQEEYEPSEWEFIDCKSVKDYDGFWTDYTMWYNRETDTYGFIFGDRDLYTPENSDLDWECDSEERAHEWFEFYEGFEDSDDDFEALETTAEFESLQEGVESPVDISKFQFKDYRNSEGVHTPGYETYRKALQSLSNKIERKADTVMHSYWGETPPAKQFRTEVQNMFSHSAVRDMVSPSAEQGLKDAWDALHARANFLAKQLEKYTKWSSGQKTWTESLEENEQDKIYVLKGDVEFDDGSTKFYELETTAPSEMKARNNFRYQICKDIFGAVNPLLISKIYISFNIVDEKKEDVPAEVKPEEAIPEVRETEEQISMFDEIGK